MEIVAHDDTAAFAQLVMPLLAADPLRHTVTITVLDGHLGTGDEMAVRLTLQDAGGVVGAVLRSPGRAAMGSAVPVEHAETVVAALAEIDPELPGVSGPVAEAEAIAAAYAARGGATDVAMRQRLFALDTLVPPAGVPGAARVADAADLDVLGGWRHAFAEEASPHGWEGTISPRHTVERALRGGAGELLWEVDGEVVAQASARRPSAGMSRIGPVYTPPEHRGHGYAAAVTAAASQWARDAGADRVVLFTDLANPTANRLYPRIGYQPVHDAVEFTFTR
ncbi:GNAT family N-acetyltransferase [Pseudonocardia sp. GCM10023141]|uniref:GNAT family N-acetyltransferase n=1 Tax=Pseudonocardia sp. GCM10023141 TaxID=3252653 RepID=UPI00361D5EE7